MKFESRSWTEHLDALRTGTCPVMAFLYGVSSRDDSVRGRRVFGLAHIDLTYNALFISTGRSLMWGAWDVSSLPVGEVVDGKMEKVSIGTPCDQMIPLPQVMRIVFLDPKVWTPFIEGLEST